MATMSVAPCIHQYGVKLTPTVVSDTPAFVAPIGGDPFEFRRELWCQSQGSILRHYLRDPTFSHFDTIPECG